MSVDLGTIFASVDLRLDGLTKNLGVAVSGLKTLSKTAQEETGKVTSSLTKLAASDAGQRIGRDMAMAGTGIAVGLAAATKAAADYDQALRNVDSIAHLTGKQFDGLHDSILSLSKDPSIRQTPQDLAKGMYEVYSSGFQGAKAMDILKVSAQGASAGMTSTSTASKALMAVLNSGIGGVTSARQAMDVLFQEVNYGVNSFEELASSIGTSLPIAAKAGISLQELTAAIGVMTRQGISASESVTELQQFILHLINPGQQAAKAMDELGIKHGMAAVKAEGLKGAIQNVIEKTKGHEDALAHLFPRIESFIGFLAIAKNGGHDFQEALDGQTHAADGLGQMMEALLRQNKGAAAQTELLKKRFAEMAIKIGEDLLPYLRELVDGTTKLIDKFESLPKPTQDAVVKFTALGAAILIVGGNAIKAVGAIVQLRNALATAGVVGGGSAAGGGLLGLLRGPLPANALTGAMARVASRVPGVNGVGRLGAGILGGTVLASPFIAGAYGINQILGQQMAASDAEGRGNGVADLSPYINRMAAIRKAHPKDYASRTDYQAADSAFRQMGGANGRGGVPTAGGSDVGMKIAEAAYRKQLDGSARTFQHQCEGLAHATYDSVTKAYSKVLDNSGGSALSALGKFKAMGLAKPYTAGMALPPGSLLYSQTMGKGSGHVQTIGPDGQRLDQYGVNRFNPRNFQFYVPPPGMGGGGKAAPGGSGGGGPAPQDAGDLADLQKRAYEATHGESQNRRYEARQQYDADKKVDPKLALATYRGMLAEISKDEREAHARDLAELKRHHAEAERQTHEHMQRLRALLAGKATAAEKTLGGGLGIQTADLGPTTQQRASGFKAAYDAGKITFVQYLNDLVALRDAYHETDAEYQALNRDIQAGFRTETARETADRVAQGKAAVNAAKVPKIAGDIALDAGDGPNASRPGKGGRGDKGGFGWIGDSMLKNVQVSIEHWTTFKGFWRSSVQEMKDVFLRAVTQMIEKWAMMQLAGKSGGGLGGIFGGAAGKGGDPGMGGGLGSLGGLLGKGGGLLGGIGKALPFVGAGLALNSLLGNPLKKIFHFSQGGVVPGHGFSDTVPAMLTPGERVLTRDQQRQGASGGHTITLNHYGDNHGAGDVTQMHSDFAWHVAQQLSTAVPGN